MADAFAPFVAALPKPPVEGDVFATHVAAAEPPTPENGNGVFSSFESFIKAPQVNPQEPFKDIPQFPEGTQKPAAPALTPPKPGVDEFAKFVPKGSPQPAAPSSKDSFAKFLPPDQQKKAAPAPKPTIAPKSASPTFADYLSGTADTLKEAAGAAGKGFVESAQANKAAGEAIKSPQDALAPIINSVNQAGDQLYEAVTTAQDQHATALQKGVAITQAGIGALNTVFSPFSSALALASKVPIIGPAADGLAGIFGALGNGEADIAGNAVDALPLSQETKDAIRPTVQQVGALTAQLLAGKAGGEVLPRIAEASKSIISKVVENMPEANQRGFVKNPFYSEPIEPEAERTSKAPIEQKAQAAPDSQTFFDSLSQDEVKTLIKSDATTEHVEPLAVAPAKSSLEPVPDLPGVYQGEAAGGSDYPNFYFERDGGELARIDVEKLSKEFYDKVRSGEQTVDEALRASQNKAQERTRLQVQSEIQDMENLLDITKDVVKEHPARPFLKYYGRNSPQDASLEDIQARNLGTGRPVAKVDTMLSEAGYADTAAAHEGVLDYLRQNAEYKQAKARLAELKRELAQMRKEGVGAEEETMKSIRSLLRPLRLPRGGNPEEINFRGNLFGGEIPRRTNSLFRKQPTETNADLIRRGANVPRVGPGPTVDARGLPQGDASENAQESAIYDSFYGSIKSGSFKGMNPDVKEWFQRAVWGRQVAPIEARLDMRQFEPYKEQWAKEGDQAFFRYEGTKVEFPEDRQGQPTVTTNFPDRSGPFQAVERLLRKYLEEEQAAGVPVREKAGYMQLSLVNDKPGAGSGIEGKRLGLRPSFTKSREFDTRADAIAAGKTPLYDNFFDELRDRSIGHYKAMADAKLWNEGVATGRIVPEPAIAEGLKPDFDLLDPKRVPIRRTAYGNVVADTNFWAPKPIADLLNNYFYNPRQGNSLQRFLAGTADVMTSTKGSVMSVGIPGTAINPHLGNLLPREVATDFAVSPKSAPVEVAKFLYYAIRPAAAKAYVDAHIEEAMPLFRNGMSFTGEEFNMRELDVEEGVLGKMGKGAKKVSDALHKLFGGNMFGGLIPARKMYNGLKLMKILQERGMTEDEAAQESATTMNTMYGGINWEALGRSRDWRNVFRSTVFAPDFLETNYQIGKNVALAPFTATRFNYYNRFATTLLGMYAVANLINYEQSGHWMFQNDPTHAFDIAWGKDSKDKVRYVKIFGTGVDFVRWPVQFALGIAEGKGNEALASITDRLSTGLSSVLSTAFNVDWRGDPILGPDRYGKAQSAGQQAINFFNNTIGNQLPGSVNALTSYLSGTQSGEQTVLQGLGLPVSYKSAKPTLADVTALKAKATAGIQKGDYTLFNELVKAGVIQPTQMRAFIRDAIIQTPAKKAATAAKTKATETAEEKAAEALLQ